MRAMPRTVPSSGIFRFLLIALLTAVGSLSAAFAQDTRLTEPILQDGIPIALESVATGLTAPTWGVPSPVGDQLIVADQAGILWSVDLDTGEKTGLADLSRRLVDLGIAGPGTFDERGLLGVALHPDYTSNGLLYTFGSEPVAGPADFPVDLPAGSAPDHQGVVLEWRLESTLPPREILRIDEPQFNHNAGALAFGPDGMLYISVGDGGGADDVDGQPFFGGVPLVGHGDGNGQNPANVLGSVLRIDPDGRSSANGHYAVPADNPFAAAGSAGGVEGCADGFCDETYAYGFRNPFRFSFDRQRGDLYLGDVGQNDIEEVDVVVAGGNYGWNLKEGTFCFDPNGDDPGFAFAAEDCPRVPPGTELVDPIAEYDTGIDGVSVIAGFVYRGSALPELEGHFVFGDFSQIFNFETFLGRLFYLAEGDVVEDGSETSRIVEFDLTAIDGEPADQLDVAVLGFAEDADGELYVLTNAGGVPFGESGTIYKIVPAGAEPPPPPPPPVTCTPGRTTLCLLDRFSVEMTWTDFEGNSGPGFATPLNDESGTFYFFSSGNLEITTKMLDGRAINGFYWYFFASMTNVEFTMTVTDTTTGATRTFTNPLGIFASNADLAIFP